jgi:hypothetical protein
MALCKRILSLLALLLGLVGLAASTVAIVAIWSVSARLSRVTENVFERIDGSLVVVRERVAQTRERVEAARITTEGIERTLRDWTKREARDRLTSRLGVEEKAERLASGLQQADHWLTFSESSVQLVQQALALANSTGAPVETEPADRLLEELASLRVQLTQVTESVERIRERTAEAGGEKLLKERIDQAVRLALRVIATLGSIDSRLEDFGKRLSETRTEARNLKTKTPLWIRIATIDITLLILWMAAGQFLLFLHGWQGTRKSRIRQPAGAERLPLDSTALGVTSNTYAGKSTLEP